MTVRLITSPLFRHLLKRIGIEVVAPHELDISSPEFLHVRGS